VLCAAEYWGRVQVLRWNDARSAAASAPATPVATQVGESTLQPPEYMAAGSFQPGGVDASSIISREEAAALAAALPGRMRLAHWKRLYSTVTDGFSLQSLYRSGARAARSVLLVEDFSGAVFGAYCTEPWRVQPRYQGSGETFVFQLRPHRIKYSWKRPSDQSGGGGGGGGSRNDFFMLVGQDSAGIGGAPHFALWLDSDLLYGTSGLCETFASPVLAGSEDFKVKSLELWRIGT
jgi:TLD